MPNVFVYPFVKLDNGTIRPLVPVIIENPFTGQKISIMALLDTGADACLFPAFIPNSTGHNLKHQDVVTNINSVQQLIPLLVLILVRTYIVI